MNVIETSADGLKREFKVIIPSDQISGQVENKIRELSRTVKLPGFRPGKVPVAVVRQRFGAGVWQEVLEETVRESAQATIRDRGLRTALQPSIALDPVDEGQDLQFTLSVELMPDIEPCDFGELALERVVVEVPEAEVDRVADRLARENRTAVPVADDRPAAADDILVVDYTALDGETTIDTGTDQRIELGGGQTLPTFDEQLVGARAGEERRFDLTLPADYAAKAVAGKTLSYTVAVKQLLEKPPVVIDDALAGRLGFPTLEAMRRAIRDQLAKNYGRVTRARLKRQLLDKLAERHGFPVPSGLVDGEFQAIWNQLQEEMSKSGVPEEDRGKDEEVLREEYRGIAERRVRLGLLLAEVGRRNNIEVTRDELNRAILAEARRYPGQEREVLEFFKKHPEAGDRMRAPLFEEKVVDFIVELAQVTERPISVEELTQLERVADGGAEA